MSPRVVITGLGVVAPNAIGADAFDAALRAGRSGLRLEETMRASGLACQVAGVPQGVDALAESAFEIEISDDDIDSVATVGDCVKLIQGKAA